MKKTPKKRITQFTMAVLILAAVFLISTALGHAQTLYTCPVTDDTYINYDRPTENNGIRNDVLVVERKSDGFAKFDLSALPANLETEEIQKATLKLWVKRVQAEGDIDLHLAEGTWDEGTLTAQSTPDIEWFYFATKEIKIANEGTFVEVDVTDVVKDWVDGTITNYGIALRPYSIEVALASKEDANSTGSTSKAMEIEVTLIGGGCPSGCKGEKGDTGPAPEHDWNGTALSFQNPDGSWGAYIDLKGDKGEPGGGSGVPGPAGPPGPQGKQGEAGPQGKQGEAGPQGKQGEQGPQGEEGPQGPRGKEGPQGPRGKDGKDGLHGQSGLQGYTQAEKRSSATTVSPGRTINSQIFCPSGKIVLGGGGLSSNSYLHVWRSYPSGKNHWTVTWKNNTGTSQTTYVRGWAICVDNPPAVGVLP